MIARIKITLTSTVFAAFCSVPSVAADELDPSLEMRGDNALEAGFGGSLLSGNYGNWQHQYVRGDAFSGRFHGYAIAQRMNRYDLSDTLLTVGTNVRLSEQWRGAFALGYSDSANFSVRQSYTAAAHYQFRRPVGIEFGVRQSEYRLSDSSGLYSEVEYYWRNFRFAARANYDSLNSTQFQTSDNGWGFRVTGSYYYEPSSRVTLALVSGDELEALPGRTLVTSVTGIAVYGEHRWHNDWALTYAFDFTKQGSLYDRTGYQLGLRYYF